MTDADEHSEVFKESVEKLTDGLVNLYVPVLKDVKLQLLELTKKQEVICRELHDENLKICKAQCDPDLQDMFNKITIYKEKLSTIKQKMIQLHEKSHKLKKRVLKLEQSKQNEASYRAQQREKEEQLIGKLPST